MLLDMNELKKLKKSLISQINLLSQVMKESIIDIGFITHAIESFKLICKIDKCFTLMYY